MLKSINALRREVCRNGSDGTVRLVADHIGKIEQEIKECYIELPRDKSGVPIHIGDKVRTKLGSTYTVARITREDYEGTTTWYIEDFASHYSLGSEDLTICKPPTVEDVLREFALEIDPSADVEVSGANIIAEYAKRLQLLEGE